MLGIDVMTVVTNKSSSCEHSSYPTSISENSRLPLSMRSDRYYDSERYKKSKLEKEFHPAEIYSNLSYSMMCVDIRGYQYLDINSWNKPHLIHLMLHKSFVVQLTTCWYQLSE